MATAAIPKRRAAVVNTPMPEKAIFTATALDPKMMHRNIENTTALRGSSEFEACCI
jgi:hypothetical protein